jgi:protein-tyrosine phosphatase
VVNVTFEIPNFFPNMYDYLKIPIKDLSTSNVLIHLHYACEYIEQALASGSAVLVHCQRGVSRSASVVIAYIMKSRRMPLIEAIKFVCKRRSCVRPNEGFVQQLVEFEASLQL